ncbi:hypothetical protein J3454_00850 [Erythrobacter sp. NFXS35]|uniref:hypothetical protein n=1 Tax=Erythrobacter sp. NFXS35 TaxID=2818436 RepID=UPI0032DEE9F4
MRESCTYTDFNPCNMPPPPGGYSDPQFDLVLFLILWVFLAAPMLMWTFGMVVVSSRKYQKVRPKSLAVEALLPPTVLLAFYLFSLISDSGLDQAISHLSSGARWLFEFPLIVALYATSIGAVHVNCWFLKSRSTASSESK